MKSEKSFFDLIDKITLRYVNHVSNIASQICGEKGKKTLNVDHVIEALKRMNFTSHIKLLTSELDLSAIQKEESGIDLIVQNTQEMKDLINKRKKKNKKRKRSFDEEMELEQQKLFEQSKIDNMQILSNNYYSNILNPENNVRNIQNVNQTLLLDQIGNDLFNVSQNNNEEEDFD